MKKTLIALAVAGFSFNAAAVDLDKTGDAAKVAKFASEIKLDKTSGVLKNGTVGKLDVDAEFGKAIQGDTKFFVRVELSNATFNTALGEGVNSALAITGITKHADNYKRVQGGTSLTNAVVYEVVAANTGSVTLDTPVAVDADAAVKLIIPDVAVNGKSDVGVTYKVYGELQQNEALSGAGAPVVTKSGTLLTFTSGVVVESTNVQGTINVNNESDSKLFSGAEASNNGKTITLGDITIKNNGSVAGANGAANAVFKDDAGKLEIAGSYAGVADKTKVAVTDFATDVLAERLVTVNFAAGKTLPVDGKAFSFTVDGETALSNSDYDATFTPVVSDAAAYELAQPTYTFKVGSIKKNAASAELKLALSGNTSFNQYIRVTNNANVSAGNLKLVVIDAAGEEGKVSLDALAPQASSAPVAVKALFAQAKADNANLNADSLLRVKVEGEGATGENVLSIESYILSKDANSVNNLY